MKKVLRWFFLIPLALAGSYLAYMATVMMMLLPLRLLNVENSAIGRGVIEITSNSVLGSTFMIIAFFTAPSSNKKLVAKGLGGLLVLFVLIAMLAVHGMNDNWGYVGLLALLVSSSLQLLSLAEVDRADENI